MKKGIVMEITGRYITVLTPEGEFVKAKNEQQNYVVGEELFVRPLEVEGWRLPGITLRKKPVKVLFASTLTALIIFLCIIPFYMEKQVYAYMSIDINPSLEVGINRSFEVVSIQAFNKDAEKLIEHLPRWEGGDVQEVTANILSISEQQGYLKKEKQVLIATVLNDAEKEEYKKELLTEVNKAAKKWKVKDITFETKDSTMKVREEAVTKGISTGSLLKQKAPKPSEDLSKPIQELKKEQVKKEQVKKDHQQPAVPERTDSSQQVPSPVSEHGASQKEEKQNNSRAQDNKKDKTLDSQKNSIPAAPKIEEEVKETLPSRNQPKEEKKVLPPAQKQSVSEGKKSDNHIIKPGQIEKQQEHLPQLDLSKKEEKLKMQSVVPEHPREAGGTDKKPKDSNKKKEQQP